MKKALLAALIAMTGTTVSAATGASCMLALPPALKYAVSYLSMMERGGSGILDPAQGREGRTPEEVCTSLTRVNIVLVSSDGGYESTLGFKNKTCVVAMKLNPEGRIRSIGLKSCR